MSELARIEAMATAFFDAIEAGDIAMVEATYAPDVVIWHNDDGIETGRDDNLKVLRGLIKGVSQRRYADRRLSVFPGGFVQQHVLHGVRRDGVAVSIPACLVCAVKDSKITRLDEYFDSAHVARFTGR